MPETQSNESSEFELENPPPFLSFNFEPGNHSQLFQGPTNIRSIALPGLFLYASLMVMYVAKVIMLPVFVALFLNHLLAPLLRGVKKYIFPRHLRVGDNSRFDQHPHVWNYSAVYSRFSLARPCPEALQQVERKIRTIKTSVLEMGKATQALEHIASLSKSRKTQKIEVKTDSLGGLLIGWTTEFIFGLVSTMILLYFFLASGDLFLENS